MRLQITVGKNLYQVQIEAVADGYEVVVNGKPFKVGTASGGFSIGDKVHKAEVVSNQGGNVRANLDGNAIEALILDVAKAPTREVEEAVKARTPPTAVAERSAKTVVAPMPGKIVRVLVKAGQAVKVGDVLLILEAMKMENEIRSTYEGRVKEVRVAAGAGVAADEPLILLE